MKCLSSKNVRTAVLVGVASLGMISGSLAGDTKKYKYIENANPGQTMNDLHIKFTQKISWAKMWGPDFEGVLGGSDSDDGYTWDWVFGQAWEMAPGAKARIDYYSDNDAAIDESASYWTFDGVKKDGFKTIADPPGASIDYDPLTDRHFGFVHFHNTEPFPVLYSGVRIYKDNNFGNFQSDDWTVPTGTLVQGVPRRIFLGPNQSKVIPVGEVQPWSYILAIANGEEAGQPNDKYGVGCAVPVIP